jgi:F-type H+-transporting ATPase subunit b
MRFEMLRRILLLALMTLALPLAASRARAADDAHHAAGTAADHAEHTGSLLPDLQDKQTYYSALWVLIIFVILLAILYPTAWKNILIGLKKREERIRGDIAEAEASRVKAEATLKQYNEQLAAAEARVRDMLSKATTDGERLATQIRMKAQQEAEEIKERSARDLESAKNAAIREVHEATVDLSTRIAEKILKRNLNADDQRDLVRSSLEQLSSVAKN